MRAYSLGGDVNSLNPQRMKKFFAFDKVVLPTQEMPRRQRQKRFSDLFHQQKTKRDKSTYILIKAN